jgi:hypothetical protein
VSNSGTRKIEDILIRNIEHAFRRYHGWREIPGDSVGSIVARAAILIERIEVKGFNVLLL